MGRMHIANFHIYCGHNVTKDYHKQLLCTFMGKAYILYRLCLLSNPIMLYRIKYCLN